MRGVSRRLHYERHELFFSTMPSCVSCACASSSGWSWVFSSSLLLFFTFSVLPRREYIFRASRHAPVTLPRTFAMPSFSRTFVSPLAIALIASLVLHATAYECPTLDNDRLIELAKTCIADKEGLCGEKCFSAVREAALNYSDDFKIPCGEGLDDVMDVLKGCIKEQGLTFDDCGGKTTERIREYADKVRCEDGGTLADKL